MSVLVAAASSAALAVSCAGLWAFRARARRAVVAEYGEDAPALPVVDWFAPIEIVAPDGATIPATYNPHAFDGDPFLRGVTAKGVDWASTPSGAILGTPLVVRNCLPEAHANDNGPELTAVQRKVLLAMHGELAFSATRMANRAGVTVTQARQSHRELRDMGLAEFGAIYDDDHHFAGRGYWLNDNGLKAQERAESEGKAFAA